MATDAGVPPLHGGRRRWWVAVLLLVVLAGLAAGWALLDDASDSGPTSLTPGELTLAQEDYDGDRVRTVGIVRRFGPEDGATRLHFVVEDAEQNRVGLIGGDPARHVGRTVVVTGTFRFSPDRGRWIDVDRLAAD